MILHIVIIFLMKLQCDALGNATSFAGKLRLIAVEGSTVNLPCTFSRNQSDMVTLILFYRNASHVGQVGAPLYTLDARMINDHKVSDVKILNSKKATSEQHPQLIRQSTDRNTFFLINNLADRLLFRSLIGLDYKHRLFKRSPTDLLIVKNKNQSRYSNSEKQSASIGNVSMVNGISSLMHLLAIKGQLNQTRMAMINGEEETTISQERTGNRAVHALNQTKLINIEKKNSKIDEIGHLSIRKANVHKTNSASDTTNYKPIFYQLQQQQQNDENWPIAEANLAEQRNQINNLFEQKIVADRVIGSETSENVDQSLNQLENQPQHFVAPQLANRIRLSWPPSQLRQHHPYNSFVESDLTVSSSNSTVYNKKLESRSQTNHIKSDPLLHFNALLNIKNATEEDAGEYLCRVDLRYGRTMIQHIVLEIVSPPQRVIILDSNSQVLHDWTNAYLENAKTIFHCEVDGGRPQTPIEWLLNGELLNPTWSKSIRLQNTGVTRSQLHLQMIRELFNSTLSCRVHNQFFTISTTVRIDLILKPQRIILRPTISPLVVDNQIDLIAQTHGSYPPADLVCFLHNETLIGEIKKANHLKLFSTTTLIIKYVPHRLDHNEEMVCKAINHAFPLNESIELRYKLDIQYKPILKLRLQNGNLNRLVQATSFALTCEIDSNPPYKEIQWFKNDLLFTALNNQIQSELRVDNTSLVTNSLSKLDSGRYTCSARNSVGTSDSEYITIDVLHAPECRSTSKFIYGIEYGETTVIDCSLISNPSDRLTFHWKWHDSNGDTIDLATISTQLDDTYKKANTNSPSYSALIQPDSNRSSIISSHDDSNSHQQPVSSRYLSAFDTIDRTENVQSSNSFANKPLSPSMNSERGNLLQQIFISSNGSSSSLHYTMKHYKKDVGSYVECWASNSIGVQKEPCMYSLVVLDVPDPVVNCTISAPINNFHLLECTPGKDGGLPPQMFHLEVYAYQDKRKEEIASGESIQSMSTDQLSNLNQLDHSENQFNSHEFKLPNQRGSKPYVKIKANHPDQPDQSEINHHHHHVNNGPNNPKINFNQPEYEDYPNYKSNDQRPNQLVLIANYTEYSYPTFVLSLVNMNLSKLNLNKLSTIDTLHLTVYSSNPKGRSNKIGLDFNIGNQTSQLKNLLTKTTAKEIKFDLLNEWTLIFTATLSTMMVWFLCLVCYLFISNKIKQIKMTRRYLNNCNKNAIKANQRNSLMPINHQGLVPFVGINNGNHITEINDLQPQCNVIGSSECHDASVYGCSSMIVNHFEQKNFKTSPNCLSSAELLKLKIKQLD